MFAEAVNTELNCMKVKKKCLHEDGDTKKCLQQEPNIKKCLHVKIF